MDDQTREPESREPESREPQSLEQLRTSLPDFARDLKLNLGSVLTPEGAPGLSERQIWAVALASAIAARNRDFTHAVEAAARAYLDEDYRRAARTAAALMGMNNIYYRFLHERKLREQGVGREAIQSAVRIAAVVHAVAGVLAYTRG
jgi:hypothetical protein